MATARTVIAFPRVSYYPRSTISFIHGDDDASRRIVVCVVVYSCGLLFSSATPAIERSFRRVFSFTSLYVYEQRSR